MVLWAEGKISLSRAGFLIRFIFSKEQKLIYFVKKLTIITKLNLYFIRNKESMLLPLTFVHLPAEISFCYFTHCQKKLNK